MIQWRKPIRNNTPQVIGPYTFKDQDGVIIDLSLFSTVTLLVKLEGQIYSELPATILSPATNGKVKCDSYTFGNVGVWSVQFYVTDGGGNRVFGEPVTLKVFANVDDLALSQILVY